MNVLVGDVGGTNVRLALARFDGESCQVRAERHFRSADHRDLASALQRYLREVGEDVARASLGVPCAVDGGRCQLVNLDWELDEEELAQAIGVDRCRLLNDFEAVGHAVAALRPEDWFSLQEAPTPADGRGQSPVQEEARGPVAVIGAGTGLGHGFAVPEVGGYAVHPSEGGHADFAPRDELEGRLLDHLRTEFGRVSYERVVSGPGLVRIYRFLVADGHAPESPEVRREMERDEPSAVISRRGLEGSDPLCVRALDLFVSAYGAQAGNFALTVHATGGVYVAGGIAPKILDKLRNGRFVEAFRDKGRFRPLMERIPVRVIVNPRVGLVGAAVAATGR